MLKRLLVLILITATLITGCSSASSEDSGSAGESLQAEDIVDNAIEASENSESHYARIEIAIYEDEDVSEGIIVQEWVSLRDGEEKSRVEYLSSEGDDWVTTSDGEEFVRYDILSDMAFVSYLKDDMNFDYNADTLIDSTYNKYIVKELELLKAAESIENLGEEEIDGIEAYHIKGNIVGGDGITRGLEVWIDKEAWMVIKVIPLQIGNRVEYKIIEYKESPEIDEVLFSQDIGDATNIVDLDKFRVDQDIIPIEKAVENMGKNILFVPKSLGYQVEIWEYIEKSKEKGINYMLIQKVSKDGASKFNIFIRETDTDTPNIGLHIDEDESDIQEIDLRDTKAYLLDTRYKRVIFQLDGIRYQLEIQDDDMNIKEAIEVIGEMKTAARN